MKITIQSSPTEVARFVSDVRTNADLERDALGFLPATVYDTAAKGGNLYVAVCEENNTQVYVGHLLFSCVFPHARIVQLFVVSRFRRHEVGRKLLQALIDLTEKLSYLHISAGVAADLPANHFYESMGFVLSRTRPGGASRNRTINVRVKHLDTLDLFKMAIDNSQGLGPVDKLANRRAVFVIDLNVFWDVVKRRPRAEFGNDIIGAAFRGLIDLVITPEFVRELRRSSSDPSNDPALEFALNLPMLRDPEHPKLETIIDGIAPLIFPTRHAGGTMSIQDRSDLAHLAIAIHHSANAFITSEKAILQAHRAIYSKYGIEVMHVKSFSSALKVAQKAIPAFHAQLSSDTLYVIELVQRALILERFLEDTSAPTEFRDDFLNASVINGSRKCIAISSDKEFVCVASWDANAGLQGRSKVRLIANEDHPAVETALNCIIHQICKEASRARPVLLLLTIPDGQTESEKIALHHGSQPTELRRGEGVHMQKVCIGRPITKENWLHIRAMLEQCSGLLFEKDFPPIDKSDISIPFTASGERKRTMLLSRLEKMLSPTLIAFPNRPGCIAPIRRGYAEQLFEGAPQMSLTPKREAHLFSERVYFSTVRNAQLFIPGTSILFYESGGDGGRASVIAVVRVLKTEIHAKLRVPTQHLSRGGC